MPIQFTPRAGRILLCDFSQGFSKPEAIKKRPVIVLASNPVANPCENGLVVVACLSTQEPTPPKPWHREIDNKFLPNIAFFQEKRTWLKGDLVYSVSFKRLNAIHEGFANGRRCYHTKVVGRDELNEIRACVRSGLNL
ncbi:type II toxin-antitoxin system PemK/MazF family toxin [Vibrio vulnificus]|nr:type II toxin-antitoxin system PemK/MazF family toxin [Vibrio vulnificus]